MITREVWSVQNQFRRGENISGSSGVHSCDEELGRVWFVDTCGGVRVCLSGGVGVCLSVRREGVNSIVGGGSIFFSVLESSM